MTTAPKLKPCLEKTIEAAIKEWCREHRIQPNDEWKLLHEVRRAAPSAGLREALEQCEKTLSKASRMLTDEYRVVLNGKVWGEKALHAARAALAQEKAERSGT